MSLNSVRSAVNRPPIPNRCRRSRCGRKTRPRERPATTSVLAVPAGSSVQVYRDRVRPRGGSAPGHPEPSAARRPCEREPSVNEGHVHRAPIGPHHPVAKSPPPLRPSVLHGLVDDVEPCLRNGHIRRRWHSAGKMDSQDAADATHGTASKRQQLRAAKKCEVLVSSDASWYAPPLRGEAAKVSSGGSPRMRHPPYTTISEVLHRERGAGSRTEASEIPRSTRLRTEQNLSKS